MHDTISQNRIRQLFFIAIILIIAVVLYLELASFLPALLGAISLYVLTRRRMFRLTEKRKWKKSLTAVLLMLLSLIIILLPIGLLVNMLSAKVAYAVQHSNELIEAIKKIIGSIENQFGVVILSEENINGLGKGLAQALPKVLGATVDTLTTVFFMYFILFFMLTNGRYMENALYEYVPLRDENVSLIGNEVNKMVLSNAIGIPLVALAQAVVGLIAYLILGVNEPFFWFGITCIAAMLPIAGAALAYIPIAIILYADNKLWQGTAMLAFGFGVIGTLDNLLRFTLLRKLGNVHPLNTVFGVIIGLNLFGFIGLIFGPLLISLFILLLKIYSNEFLVKQRNVSKYIEN